MSTTTTHCSHGSGNVSPVFIGRAFPSNGCEGLCSYVGLHPYNFQCFGPLNEKAATCVRDPAAQVPRTGFEISSRPADGSQRMERFDETNEPQATLDLQRECWSQDGPDNKPSELPSPSQGSGGSKNTSAPAGRRRASEQRVIPETKIFAVTTPGNCAGRVVLLHAAVVAHR